MVKKDHRPDLEHEGIRYDSKEEIEFKKFVESAKQYGLIDFETYQPESYQLIPKALRPVTRYFKTKAPRVEWKSLFREHSYTPDWIIRFTPEFFENFPRHGLFVVASQGSEVAEVDFKGAASAWFDVKGKINLHGGDRIFPIHQKLMWDRFKIPVNKLIPEEFFRRIGVVPDGVKWMKNRKQKTARKAYIKVPTFEELFGKEDTNTNI